MQNCFAIGSLVRIDMDGFGIQGTAFHYGLVFSLVGSAFLLFVYFWKKGRLDMDEEPKYRMFEEGEKK